MPPSIRASRPHFGVFEVAQFGHSQRLRRDQLLGLVKSRSYVAVRPVDEQNEILARVAELFDRFAKSGELVMHYVTHCYRGTRNAST